MAGPTERARGRFGVEREEESQSGRVRLEENIFNGLRSNAVSYVVKNHPLNFGKSAESKKNPVSVFLQHMFHLPIH